MKELGAWIKGRGVICFSYDWFSLQGTFLGQVNGSSSSSSEELQQAALE